jgi:hypothetical protein
MLLPGNLPQKLAQDALGQPGKNVLPHDHKALGKGGQLTLDYAVSLAGTGVSRDYVARALLARGVDPELTRDLVETAFQAAGKRARSRSAATMAGGGLLVLAGVLCSYLVARSSGGSYWSPVGVGFVTFGAAALVLGWIGYSRAHKA